MRKIIPAIMGAVALACGGSSDDSLRYGAPQAPTYDEQLAVESAQTTLASTAAYQQDTEPALGAPGLADQMAANLGAYGGTAAAPADPLRTMASRSLSRASRNALTVGMDPACVQQQVGRIDWVGCVITASDYDPYTGDTMDMTVTVNGWLTWNEATGVTAWDLVQEMDVTMTSDGQTMTLDATARPSGSITVAASTIAGQARSSVNETISYMGTTISAGVLTTLGLDVEYQADPFCITGGWLELEQVWTRRPAGYGEAQLPDQGWRFDWTGCGQFTVSHGS